MTVLDIENTSDATTEHWSAKRSESDQSNPVTRRVSLDGVLGELETSDIERNAEFHATIVSRLVERNPVLIDPDRALEE